MAGGRLPYTACGLGPFLPGSSPALGWNACLLPLGPAVVLTWMQAFASAALGFMLVLALLKICPPWDLVSLLGHLFI